jgi:hypothetical protein
MMDVSMGFWIIALLFLLFLLSLPFYPYSRAWGYRPGTAFLALLLLAMIAMWIAGILWWPWASMHDSAT